jgi:hypothetical protein
MFSDTMGIDAGLIGADLAAWRTFAVNFINDRRLQPIIIPS